MGLNPFWQEDVLLTIQAIHHEVQINTAEPYFIISCSDKLMIHLVDLDQYFKPEDLVALQAKFQEEGIYLVHLWEDVWMARRAQVLSRIRSFLGLNKRLHGRKAKIETISTKQSTAFLNQYHLQGYIKAKFSYGLVINTELIAIATFSDARPMKSKGEHYQSTELVRFATKDGITVAGGLSKLIKHHLKQVKVNDLMTYADRDWSLGKGYDAIGFTLSEITEPAYLYVDRVTLIRYFPHRLPKTIIAAFEAQNILNLDDFLQVNDFSKLFNTGNLKYHLYL